MQLGIHTFSLNLHGIGQPWAGFELPWPRQLSTFELLDRLVGWGLDGVHLDDAVLESLDEPYLREVGAAARERNLYLEYNFSLDLACQGIGTQHGLGEALDIAHALGADVVKVGMDLVRPRPVAASRFHPAVVEQMEGVISLLRGHADSAQERDIRIALENHCDSFSEEVLWMLDRVDHPAVGACVDTMNGLAVMEDPMRAIESLAPRGFTNHFRDEAIEFQIYGLRSCGRAVGEGDLDMRRAYEFIRDSPHMDRINIQTDLDIALDDKDTALRTEIGALERSIRYCREVLGVGREDEDGAVGRRGGGETSGGAGSAPATERRPV